MNAETQTLIRAVGIQDGKEWRDELATKGQLTRLRRFNNDQPDFDLWFDEVEHSGWGFTSSDQLAFIINPKFALDFSDDADEEELIADFWAEICSEAADTDDVDYLHGFLEGALSETV